MNRHGLHICLADANAEALKTAERLVADIAGSDSVLAIATDISKLEQVEHLRDEAMAKFGEASII
jgi:NAD(P)-dependent dehydrogenase (short-subunit alcohol dehydrogenase family)